MLGQDLWTLVTDGPEEALNQTVNTQPVMLTAGVAVWRAWQAAGGADAGVVAGHSLGEYTALVAAGALAFRDALPLVRFRAQAMQDAVPAGRRRDGGDPRPRRGRRGRRVRGSGAGPGASSPSTSTRPSRSSSPDTGRRSSARSRPPRRAARSAACCCRCRRRSTARCMRPAAERLAARLADVPVVGAVAAGAAQRRRRRCTRSPTRSGLRWRSRRRAPCAGSRPSGASRRAA